MMDSSAYKKITVIGPSDVGKTTLIFRMKYQCFEENIQPTIGAAYTELIIKGIDNQDYTLQFWDTAGMERYATVVPMYYPNTFIFWLVFDLSSPESLRKLQLVAILLFQKMRQDIRVYLIGNKKDLVSSVTWKSDIEAFKNTLFMSEYFEVSAKSGENINLILYQLQKDCCTTFIPRTVFVELAEPTEDKGNKKCC